MSQAPWTGAPDEGIWIGRCVCGHDRGGYAWCYSCPCPMHGQPGCLPHVRIETQAMGEQATAVRGPATRGQGSLHPRGHTSISLHKQGRLRKDLSAAASRYVREASDDRAAGAVDSPACLPPMHSAITSKACSNPAARPSSNCGRNAAPTTRQAATASLRKLARFVHSSARRMPAI